MIDRVRARNAIQRLSRMDNKVADLSALVLVVQSFVREYLHESEATPRRPRVCAT